MGTVNTNGRFDSARHLADEQFEALKSGMHKLVDRVMTQSDGLPSRVQQWMAKATEAAKAHPYLAIGIALGSGYAIVKIARR